MIFFISYEAFNQRLLSKRNLIQVQKNIKVMTPEKGPGSGQLNVNNRNYFDCESRNYSQSGIVSSEKRVALVSWSYHVACIPYIYNWVFMVHK